MAFLFSVRIPRDPAFVPPLRDLADRVAQYAGYAAGDAHEIGGTVRETAAALAQSAASPADLDIQFRTSGTTFEVTVAFEGVGGAEPHLSSGAMDAVAVARDGARTVCQLTRKLPDAFLD
jgi:hypothetical protein